MAIYQFNQRQSLITVFSVLAIAVAGSLLIALVAGYSGVVTLILVMLVVACCSAVAFFHYRTALQLKAFQDILEASPSGILCVNVHGLIQYANPIACSIFQYEVNRLDGMSVETLIPTDIRARHPQLRSSFLRERRSRRMGEGRDIRGVTQSGQEVPLEIGLTFLGEGESALIIVGVIDISDLKNAKDIIQRQNQNLARSVKELEQFAFSASHDLREPLRKVMNYIEILQEDYHRQIDDDGNRVLLSMGGAVQRMERLLDSLLSYSRVTTRAQPFETVALAGVVADVVEDLSLLLSETEATIQYGNLPSVQGDRNQLRQLFQNLISNSLKYRREDVPTAIRIESSNAIHTALGKGYCAVEISDNGIGFDNQYSELIFDVFKRLHGRDKYPGTGMGLAICRKIVERHEGVIRAEGSVNSGATFTIWLKEAPKS